MARPRYQPEEKASFETFTSGKEIDYYKILGYQEYVIAQIGNSFLFSRANNRRLKKAIRMYEGSVPTKLKDKRYIQDKKRIFDKLKEIPQKDKNEIEEYYDLLVEWFTAIQDVLHRHGILIPVRTKVLA